MAIEIFNRYEQKYILNSKDMEMLLPVIQTHMDTDPYNQNGTPYTISNIYYDTPDDHMIRTSLGKPRYKEKLRLRGYGVPGPQDKVFLEIKKKYKGIVNKRRTTLSLPEAYAWLETGTAPTPKPYMNKQVLCELAYSIQFYRPVAKVYLAYDRLAFFDHDDPDLRISFDQNIRTRRASLRLEAGSHGCPLIPENTWIMEIKTAKTMPLWLTNALASLNIRSRSFSKYGAEYQNMLRTTQNENQMEALLIWNNFLTV